jgi:hypothetical protein
MRVSVALVIVGLSACGPGCALLTDSARTMCHYVADSVEDVREGFRNRHWAELAWKDLSAAEPGTHSDDFALGFKRGFADYLDKGGSGEPPVLPPPRYRHLRYQTPQGYAAIEEWFAGYRRGVEAARESGLRQWITGPTSLRPPGAVVLTPPAHLGSPVLGLPDPEFLPPPQKAAPEPADERARPALQPPMPEPEDPPPPRVIPGPPVPVPDEAPAAPTRTTLGTPAGEGPPPVLPVILGPPPAAPMPIDEKAVTLPPALPVVVVPVPAAQEPADEKAKALPQVIAPRKEAVPPPPALPVVIGPPAAARPGPALGPALPLPVVINASEEPRPGAALGPPRGED